MLLISLGIVLAVNGLLTWANWPEPFEQEIYRAVIEGFTHELGEVTDTYALDHTISPIDLDPMEMSDLAHIADQIDTIYGVRSSQALTRMYMRSLDSVPINFDPSDGSYLLSRSELDDWYDDETNTGISLELTRPALIDEDWAIVGLVWWGGILYGGSEILLLQKDGGGWEIRERLPLWQS